MFCAGLAAIDMVFRLAIQPPLENAEHTFHREPSETDGLLTTSSTSTLPIPDEDQLEKGYYIVHQNYSSSSSSTSLVMNDDHIVVETKTSSTLPSSSSSSSGSPPSYPSSTSNSNSSQFFVLMTDGQCLCTALLIIIIAAVFSGIEPSLPVFLLSKFNLDPSEIGLIFISILLPNMTTCLLVGGWSDRVGRKNVAAFGLFLCALACPLIPLAGNLWTLSLALASFGKKKRIVSW